MAVLMASRITPSPAFFSNSLHGRFIYWIVSFCLGGHLGKKRMAGVDGLGFSIGRERYSKSN